MSSELTRQAAIDLDANDDLAYLRDRFQVPEGVHYLDGNSLGILPRAVLPSLTNVVEQQWGQDLIRSWNINDWWTLPARTGDRIGALLGAAEGQVMCGDSTSVQLFQMLVAGSRLRPGRSLILTDGGNFPTDQYIADSVADLLGLQVVRLHPSELGNHLSSDVAVVSFSQVDYRTGELFAAREITHAVQQAGALMLWDLCHSAGALPIELDEIGVDLAVGCSYKYLNGGPGAPAFCYIAQRHQASVRLPLTGWHGHRDPFALNQHYVAADSIERTRIGSPPVLSMAALDAALSVFDELEMTAVRMKSLALTELAIEFSDTRLAEFGVEVVTPRDPARRGSHVSLRMPAAYQVCQALIERGVIGDFREPDLLRLGFTPLYLRYVDVFDAFSTLAEVLADGSYHATRFSQRAAVT